jgi:hypothetical protein
LPSSANGNAAPVTAEGGVILFEEFLSQAADEGEPRSLVGGFKSRLWHHLEIQENPIK